MGKIIKNLSVRKTILLYLMLSLICSCFLSAYISMLARHTQAAVWQNYTDPDKYSVPGRSEYAESLLTPDPYGETRPAYSEMTPAHRRIDDVCDFLQSYTILILSITGSCISVFLFYRNKLKYPLLELTQASRNISQNNLMFHITYENKDELGQLCREFEQMRAQLVENNILLWRSLDEERALRAAISHDIRSPLSVLKGYHEMLTDYLPGEAISMEKAMDMLAECGKQLERMDKFVETMQRLSSLERRELYPDELTARQLQAELSAEISILEKESGKKILFRNVTPEESFRGDQEIILEVTENLLSNALRYARETVEITLDLRADECWIRITDDGCGFSASTAKAAKACSPQNPQNIRDSLNHSGLGMYISRLYCEKHGGRLLTENLQQGGASVTAVFGRIV